MKAVLISIQPKWVEKICKGEKTIEVRKTKPNLQTPFKCYIYCTKDKTELPIERKINRELEDLCDGYEILYWANGKVIGEFICDNIERFDLPMPAYFSEVSNNIKELLEKACLSMSKAHHYIDDKDGYGWHISDLKIYDKPKELSEFRTICKTNKNDYDLEKCCECKKALFDEDGAFCGCDMEITRPPQSWCYVEELTEGDKALGYVTKEIVEEFGEEDGEMVLKKKKVTSKSVPPDITAIKLVVDIKDEDDDFTKLSDEELEKEKIRLLKMLEESNNG